MSQLLDPSALLSALPGYLPPTEKQLKCPQDGIAALLHAAFAALSFRLIAVDDASPANQSLTNVFPKEWNKTGPAHYTFRYKHEQSSLEYILTVAKLSGRTLINAIASQTDKAASLDISTNDFMSPSFFPHDVSAANAPALVHGFISSNRVADLISQFKLKIVQKLMPGLHKEGYTEEVEESSTATSSHTQPRSPPVQRPDPDYPPPHVHPNRNPYSHIPPDNPLEIGRRDLDPFPDSPFSPPSLFPNSGGDGMFVGPQHPIFGHSGRHGGQFPRTGPWGGDGFLPPMGAPPGARFDPVGPFPGVGRGSGRFPGRGNAPGPDNDEFMPPGAGDMFM